VCVCVSVRGVCVCKCTRCVCKCTRCVCVYCVYVCVSVRGVCTGDGRHNFCGRSICADTRTHTNAHAQLGTLEDLSSDP
jgi:hypothetical protein